MTPDPFSLRELAGWGSGHETIREQDEHVCHKCSEKMNTMAGSGLQNHPTPILGHSISRVQCACAVNL